MNQQPTASHEKFMRRALQIAALGRQHASPNPMVGAVVVHNGKIIGEGWHRRCGEPHAEVNAINSVGDKTLLSESTIYVTLEPCSHYGKTPPCAKLLIDSHIPRVVIASIDPFEKVAGRGVAMLKDAGIEVITGVLDREARELNKRFFTAHTLKRPYVTLKWAQSADGYMDHDRSNSGEPAKFSTAITSQAVHKLRSLHDAILTTSATVKADSPRMDARLWIGEPPRKVIIDRKDVLAGDERIFAACSQEPIVFRHGDFQQILRELYSLGITSVVVEAGPTFLQSAIDSGVWDEIRIETSPTVLGDSGRAKAPLFPGLSSEVVASSQGRFCLYTRPLSR